MCILWERIPTRYRHHVCKKRWISILVLFKQMQKELNQIEARCSKVSVDKLLRKGGERKSLTQRTLVLLKPEAVMRGLIGEIVTRIERKGFTICAMKLIQVTQHQAEMLYEMHRGKTFYEPLVKHISSDPVLTMVVEGPNVISVLRSMIGATNPKDARPGTIRGDLALNVQKNIIHAADSAENAKKEINILFKRGEILRYQKPTETQYSY